FAFNMTDNRISSLTNSGTHGSGVTYTSYTYDANGNTTHDGRTGQDLAWNELNLIAGVSQGSGAASSTLASYTWMADGAKYASARADGTGYVYKGALVFEILKEFKENGLWVSHQIDDNCFVIRRETLSQSKYEAALKVIGNKGENGLNIK
ncbi:MAG: hypothetical protein II791_05320, partial [Bacteroidales bacterium]|nr:hypothetical protein [Bacteroidales bacterium]